MTVILDRPVTTPRTLISHDLFDRLTARIAVDHPAHAHQADIIMEQALAFLSRVNDPEMTTPRRSPDSNLDAKSLRQQALRLKRSSRVTS